MWLGATPRWRDQDEARQASLSVEKPLASARMCSSRERNFEPAHASLAGFMRAFSQTPNISHVHCLSLLGMLSSGGQTTTAGVS